MGSWWHYLAVLLQLHYNFLPLILNSLRNFTSIQEGHFARECPSATDDDNKCRKCGEVKCFSLLALFADHFAVVWIHSNGD